MRIISAKDVLTLISIPEAIKVLQTQMILVSNRECILPLRNIIDLGDSKKIGSMTGSLGVGKTYGIKVLSLFPENPSKGLSSHLGVMIIFDPKTGIPLAGINADALTAVRTAAATAVATKELARENASSLTIIGTGEQAEYHIEAIPHVRKIKNINVVGTSRQKADNLIVKVSPKYPNMIFKSFDKVEEIIPDSDIICSVTSSKNSIIFGDWISKGTHINAIGASIPLYQEIDLSVLMKTKIFVDFLPSVLSQAKEIIDAIALKKITEDDITAEIGEVLAGVKKGRLNQSEITLYRSMGIAAQDLACAEFIFKMAEKKDIGILAPIV